MSKLHWRTKDLTGKAFGRWVVTKFDRYIKDSHGCRAAWWLCRCECGDLRSVRASDLIAGYSKSCGCLKVDTNRTHGQSESKEYKAWASMKNRCANSRDKWYPHYGGRGIKVCNRWLYSFENFFADMGKAPQGSSIDRINNDGGYNPDNCRWATATQQSRNRRAQIGNTSGVRGVSRHSCGKWVVQIYATGVQRYIGLFDDLSDAERARRRAELEFWRLPELRSAIDDGDYPAIQEIEDECSEQEWEYIVNLLDGFYATHLNEMQKAS